MNDEPDAGGLDVDTDEWPAPESVGDESAVVEGHEQAAIAADEPEWADQAETGDEPRWVDPAAPAGLLWADESEPANATAPRVQGRHARPRDLRRFVTMALGGALIVAVGFALYFWLQLGSARGERDPEAPATVDLSSELAQANARLAETEQALREAQVRIVDAETEARELQEELDATIAASADADDDLAEASEQLQAVSESLTAVRSQGEALASAVLGSVDPVHACVQAAQQVADNVDQVGRGQLARQARAAAATCAAAQESLGPAVDQARGVLAD